MTRQTLASYLKTLSGVLGDVVFYRRYGSDTGPSHTFARIRIMNFGVILMISRFRKRGITTTFRFRAPFIMELHLLQGKLSRMIKSGVC